MPCGGETWITGNPASSLARKASSSTSSWGARSPVTYSSTAVHLPAATGEVYQEPCSGRKAAPLPERAGMETASRRARRRERWMQRAERVSDAFGLVFVLVLVTYVLASLLDNRGWTAVVLTLATSATSVVALTSSHARAATRADRRRALGADERACRDRGRQRTITTGSTSPTLIQVSLLAVAMGAVLRRVVMAPEVGSRTILGALSVYAVLGILFTFLYGVIDRIQGGPFFEGRPNPAGSDFLFFSYTTLTTTGYGNLVPGGQPGG